jgi:hypothetical protein
MVSRDELVTFHRDYIRLVDARRLPGATHRMFDRRFRRWSSKEGAYTVLLRSEVMEALAEQSPPTEGCVSSEQALSILNAGRQRNLTTLNTLHKSKKFRNKVRHVRYRWKLYWNEDDLHRLVEERRQDRHKRHLEACKRYNQRRKKGKGRGPAYQKPRYTVEEKRWVVLQHLQTGKSRYRIGEELGISPQSIDKWKREFLAGTL